MLWSDEKLFKFQSSATKKTIRIYPCEKFDTDKVEQLVKFGGGTLMIWGSISSLGVGYIKFF